MAGKSSPQESTLLEITSEWFLDYCIYQLWKEFKEKRSFSDFWRDALQDYLLNGRFPIGEELSSKLSCIRFIIGLLERQEGDVCSSQESSPSDEEDRCEQTHKRLLGPDCLKFFDKITRIYPFSNVEKSHMKSSLKLQIILSHYRRGDVKGAETLFSRLYSENGDDEEYQDDLRELFQSQNDTFKEKFLRKHTYDKLLIQVQKFFMPAWKKFEIPILEEAPLLENSTKERPRIDAKTVKALYFAWDKSDEVDQNWTSIVERTHPDITALKKRITKGKSKDSSKGTHADITAPKKRIAKGKSKDSSSNTMETSPSILPQQQVTKSKAEASSTTAVSGISERIQQCEVVKNDLKASSSKLFSSLKDQYSDMIAEKAGSSGINDDADDHNDNDDDDVNDDDQSDQDFIVNRRCKTVVAIPDSPSGNKQHKRGRKSLGPQSTKRRYNEEHSDAEEIDWASDDEETKFKHKAIKLPSPARPRCLNVKLPILPPRKFWSAEETRWLEEGVKLYGIGNWTKILNKYNFVGRTSINLKDKWRNLQKKD